MRKIKRIMSLFILTSIIIPNCFAATTATVTVTATVLPGQSEISLDATSIDFGPVSGSVNDRRFIAPRRDSQPVKVSYFAGTSPWTIRVYTANPGDVTGLIGVTDPNENIPLKIWCDNYGPIANQTGIPPNEENTYFWRGYDFNGGGIGSTPITSGPDISEVTLGFDVNGDGDAFDVITPSPTKVSNTMYPVPEEPVWLRIPDDTEMIPGNPYTWRRLCYTGAELDAGGFPIFLAIDVTRIPPQQYRTTTLTFQIIGE